MRRTGPMRRARTLAEPSGLAAVRKSGCPPPTGDPAVEPSSTGSPGTTRSSSARSTARVPSTPCSLSSCATLGSRPRSMRSSSSGATRASRGSSMPTSTGADVPDDELASVWRESTQGAVWEQGVYRRFFELVRAVNATLPEDERLRVLAGDPPVDRATITATTECDDRDPTCLDHWIFQREESFATVTLSVLDGRPRGRARPRFARSHGRPVRARASGSRSERPSSSSCHTRCHVRNCPRRPHTRRRG